MQTSFLLCESVKERKQNSRTDLKEENKKKTESVAGVVEPRSER